MFDDTVDFYRAETSNTITIARTKAYNLKHEQLKDEYLHQFRIVLYPNIQQYFMHI